MLAGGTLVLFVVPQAQESSEPLGCIGVWRLLAGAGSMGSPADWAAAQNTPLQ